MFGEQSRYQTGHFIIGNRICARNFEGNTEKHETSIISLLSDIEFGTSCCHSNEQCLASLSPFPDPSKCGRKRSFLLMITERLNGKRFDRKSNFLNKK